MMSIIPVGQIIITNQLVIVKLNRTETQEIYQAKIISRNNNIIFATTVTTITVATTATITTAAATATTINRGEQKVLG